MTPGAEAPRLIVWLRRQRRLAWRAILVCTLLRIGGAAMASDSPPAAPISLPAAASEPCPRAVAPAVAWRRTVTNPPKPDTTL